MFKIISNFKRFVKNNQRFIRFGLFICVFSCFWFLFGFCVGKKLIQKDNILIYGNVLKVSDILGNNGAVEENKKEIINENIYYVASSRGKYYYPNNCSLADSLSPKNLLKFNTEEEAKKAGYIFNTRCK